jgi:hypothetical protein
VWTLALRGGARVAVVAAEWCDAFGVVTRGRVQLELRDGEPGPVLGRDAGFWLRGTGIRALRNPGRPTATARIVTPRARTVTCRSTHPRTPSYRMIRNDMNSMKDSGSSQAWHRAKPATPTDSAGSPSPASLPRSQRRWPPPTLAAALAQAVGVDFEVPDGGETIPLSEFAVVTGVISVVGIVIAVALLRWSARPAERFAWTAVSLTAISLVPPLLSGANTATTTLLGLHLVAATVMIPTLARSLRTRTA